MSVMTAEKSGTVNEPVPTEWTKNEGDATTYLDGNGNVIDEEEFNRLFR